MQWSCVESIAAKKKQRAQFFKTDVTWIVSDLESKYAMQDWIQTAQGHSEEDQILRASELWTKLLQRSYPQVRVVSRDYVLIQIGVWLTELNITDKPETIYSYITEFMPVLSHPGDEGILEEWLEENPDIYKRWEPWLKLAKIVWFKCIQAEFISAQWVSGYLVNCFDFEKIWDRPLVFDLGGDLKTPESELIHRLSRKVEVIVLEPSPPWAEKFSYLLAPYQKLRELSQARPTNADSNILSEDGEDKYKFERHCSQLAEVKRATAWVRELLDQNIPAKEIAIFASDIEEYWGVLRPHLESEGIPINKAQVIHPAELGKVQRWLSGIRRGVGSLDRGDHELFEFGSESKLERSFDEFKTQAENLYELSDLKRLSQASQEAFDKESLMKRDQFFEWAMNYWLEPLVPSYLEKIASRFYQESVDNDQWALQNWIFWLEKLCDRIEIEVQPSSDRGIHLLNFSSGDYHDIYFKCFLGLSEDGIKGKNNSPFRAKDLMSLEAKTGHILSHPDRRSFEFQLQWHMSNPENKSVLCLFPEADFMGNPLVPAQFWLEARSIHEDVLVVLKPEASCLRDFYMSRVELATLPARLRDQLEVEAGKTPLEPLSGICVESLSAAGLQKFISCPFAFAAERIMGLKDLSMIDLDLDNRDSGTILHNFLEKLSGVENFRSLELPAILLFVDEFLRGQKNLAPLSRERTKRLLPQLGLRFIRTENEWKQKHPHSEIAAREFNFDVRAGNSEYLSAKRLKGKIDRTDENSAQEQVLIDYKSATSALTNWGSWQENQEFQLLFYTFVLENRLGKKVIGAHYYSLRDGSRKGFEIEGADPLTLSPRSKSSILGSEEKHRLLLDLENRIEKIFKELDAGQISPVPLDPKECTSCSWRKQCRAPHLNL